MQHGPDVRSDDIGRCVINRGQSLSDIGHRTRAIDKFQYGHRVFVRQEKTLGAKDDPGVTHCVVAKFHAGAQAWDSGVIALCR